MSDLCLTPEERAQVLAWIEESHQAFLAAIDGLSAAQCSWKPAPETWSIAEIAEHIVLTEAVLFKAVQRALATPANPDCHTLTAGKTELIVNVMVPRLGRATAPDRLIPKGLPITETLAQFHAQRGPILDFCTSTELPLKAHTVDHPMPVFNTLNAYQWLIYVPLHTLRHTRQIAEIKATPGYPE